MEELATVGPGSVYDFLGCVKQAVRMNRNPCSKYFEPLKLDKEAKKFFIFKILNIKDVLKIFDQEK